MRASKTNRRSFVRILVYVALIGLGVYLVYENSTSFFISNELPESMKSEIWTKPNSPAIPPLHRFSLTEEMAELRSRNSVIFVAVVNIEYLDFTLNWVRHLTNIGISKILVGAMDTAVLEALYLEGIPVFYIKSDLSSDDPQAMGKIGIERVKVVQKLLSMNYKVLICDTDMVWLKDPTAWLASWPDADIITSSLVLTTSVKDNSLESWNSSDAAAYDSGVLFLRPTAETMVFVADWAAGIVADKSVRDRDVFNLLARQKYGPSVNNGTSLFWAFHGSLKLGVMPVTSFCNGHTYFLQRLYSSLDGGPFMIHPTYTFGGPLGKKMRLRSEKLFYDKPEYYNPANGVISFDLHIPSNVLSQGSLTLESHFALVNYQLVRIRSALALATILNRTLIMPEIRCQFDKLWFPHHGVIPGTISKQPFVCPVDHVFNVEQMFVKLEESEFGPSIDFRESNFLKNPRVSQTLSKSVVEVETCRSGGKNDCPVLPSSNQTINGTVLQLPEMVSSQMVHDFLHPFKSVKRLHFSSLDSIFRDWDDKEAERKFNSRIALYPGVWCCVFNATPGHIWYDFFNDKRGSHWLPKPPKDWADDSPRTFSL